MRRPITDTSRVAHRQPGDGAPRRLGALPHHAEPAWGAVAGLGIAALDLSVIGRRIPAIRALPQGRQWADHVAFGLAVGLVLQKRRSGDER